MPGRWLVATRKGLFTITPSGDRWEISGASFLGDNVPIALADPRDGALYAALEHGHFGTKLHKSTDAGSTWTEIGVPTYPEPTAEQAASEKYKWKLEKIWSLEPGGPDEPGVLWCGTMPGGLFRSADGGQTWSIVDGLWRHPSRAAWFGGGADFPGIHSVCVDTRNSQRLAVGVSCAGVWASDDGGSTWDCRAKGMRAEYMPPDQAYDPLVQDPHRIVRCPSAPDHLWAQHHNGVFRSTDDSANWSEIHDVPPSGFGFAVAVHPTDPDTAWFVPAIKDEKRIPVSGRVVVSRTRDGGRSFDVLSSGLPQHHAYDLVFRHSLDIDPTGDVLAFGSTTGSLWITNDAGNHWQTVSQHLPPVYCVRYAA